MDKDLEKEYLADLDHYDEGMGIHSTSYEKTKERLIRLAKIDSAQPSEAIKCWRNMQGRIASSISTLEYFTIEQALLKAQENDKVLDVIIEKSVNIYYLKDAMRRLKQTKDIVENYNAYIGNKDRWITEAEFEAIKRRCEKK